MKAIITNVVFIFVILIFSGIDVCASNKQVSFQGEFGYPPYTYEKDGFLTGFDTDLTNLIFNSSEYELRYSIESWESVYKNVKMGTADTCGLLAINEQRKKDLLFSKPILHFYISIYTRTGFQKVTVNELHNYKVGLGKGQFSEQIYKEKIGVDNYAAFETLEDALNALQKGDIDVLFENQEVINYLIVHNSLNNKILNQQSSLFPVDVAYGVSKTKPELVKYINSRFDKLVKVGVYEELYKKYFFTHSEIYKAQLRIKIITLVVFALFIIVLSSILLKRYINKLKRKLETEHNAYEKMLKESYEKLSCAYEELTESKEELIIKYEELAHNEKKLLISEERFRLASEGSNDMIWDVDLMNQKFYISDRWYEILGYDNIKTFDYIEWNSYLHPEDLSIMIEEREKHFKGETPFYSCEYRIRAKNGEYKWFYSRGKALFDTNRNPQRFSGSLTDVTENKENELKLQNSYQELEATYEELYAMQEELKQQYDDLSSYKDKLQYTAYHDPLTGLLNRQRLYEGFSQINSDPLNINTGVMFIDLDNFKYINDTLGHSYGDQLILNIAQRLMKLLNEDWQKIYRFGGDEFVVCLYNYSDSLDINIIAEEIINSFKEPFILSDSIITVTISMGIALYPMNGNDIDGLVKNADIALYKAKSLGKNRYVFFNETMNTPVVERMHIENQLRNALDKKEFVLYYQPQVDLKKNNIVGFEALIRWKNPVLGMVSPLKFIKVAEDTHLIIPIGEWILRSSCLFIKGLHNKGYCDLTIAVNISVIQLLQDSFVDMVTSIITEVGINPICLELEITESILIESYETVCKKLELLRKLGIQLALDDFGQGYSSLSYLKQLPINTLKIDKIFIDSISNKDSEESLAASIISIGHKMSLKVVAEGVELKDQLDYLKMCNCDVIQGYIFSKPLPELEAEELLKNKRTSYNM
jgi:diguanylate cyclase (GGDEF)-like protein/PAS domain S-box-containing protein